MQSSAQPTPFDTISIFALTCADAARVLNIAQDYDAVDAYARPAQVVSPFSSQQFRFGVPDSNLGYYTNFMNLLDLSAVAVPAGFRNDGLPFGVTLMAPAFKDTSLPALADRLHRARIAHAGALKTPLPDEIYNTATLRNEIAVAVCGAHMEGLALNHQLTEHGARLLQCARTAASYRFYALPGGPPHRPGLVRVESDGGAIEVEVWAVPSHEFGSFVAQIPAPLGIGKIELADGSRVSGFICEAFATRGAQEITALGSWRTFLAKK